MVWTRRHSFSLTFWSQKQSVVSSMLKKLYSHFFSGLQTLLFVLQVFGCKRVILYSPEDSENLYPFESRLLDNTAQVDPYRPSDDKWPNFQKAKGHMCYLKPGEMLYIPPKWWHHVVSLSPSFSISFWWNWFLYITIINCLIKYFNSKVISNYSSCSV